jgi:general secretion pathway protein C
MLQGPHGNREQLVLRNSDLARGVRRGMQGMAMVAAAAGAGVWGAILLAPQPGMLPPAIAGSPPQDMDARPVAAWFEAGPASRVKLVSSGLISAGAASSAILAVDGGTPRAYGVGHRLAQDLVLAEVSPDGVVILQGVHRIEVAAPRLPPVSGISSAVREFR